MNKQRHMTWVWSILISFSVITCLGLIAAAYGFRWPQTGIRDKTLWDWLQLLIIPLALALIAVLVNQANTGAEHKIAQQRYEQDQAITLDKQREDLLQNYFDKMSELLLEKKLRTTQLYAEERNVARARTINILIQLDARRIGYIFAFLHEAGLQNISQPIISLQGANLKGVKWHEANLSEANLNGAILTEANISNAMVISVDFSNATLIKTNFSDANIADANFNKAHLSEANFNKSSIFKSNFIKTDLSEANLNETDAIKANFSKANLSSASLRKFQGIDVIFSEANLIKADLSRTYLRKANFSEANLSGANLSGANLRGANLSGANLSGANLSGANLSGANLNKAILKDAIIDRNKLSVQQQKEALFE